MQGVWAKFTRRGFTDVMAVELQTNKDGQVLLYIGDRVVEATERPMADGGTISLRFDVTKREQALAQLAESRNAAEKASKAKSDFLASMSHEFRTPLNAIIGFGQVLQLDPTSNLTAEQKGFLADIERSGKHLLSLVNEVLDLAGIEAGKLKLTLEALAPDALLSQVISEMRPVAEKAGVSLLFIPGRASPVLAWADERRVRQIALNLIANAIKYNRAGGTVQARIQVLDDKVRLAVEDNGVGISESDQKKVFTKFERLGAERSAIEGAGIGLSLCKSLAEAMGGAIGFRSEPGQGSIFWLDLPITEPMGRERAEGDQAPDQPARERPAGYSLLYVEDNPDNVRLMESMMAAKPGVELISAESGPRGIDAALTYRPDIILLDLALPGLNGLDVLKRLKSAPELAGTPIFALSAAAQPEDVRKGLDAGFDRYFTKPLDVKAFLEAIDNVIESDGAEPSAERRARA